MPDLSLKGLDESLMRAVKVSAAKADLTQRDWVVKTLAKAVGWEREGGNGDVYKVRDKVVEAQVQVGEVQAVRGEPGGDAEGTGEPERKEKAGKVAKKAGGIRCPRCESGDVADYGVSWYCRACQRN